MASGPFQRTRNQTTNFGLKNIPNLTPEVANREINHYIMRNQIELGLKYPVSLVADEALKDYDALVKRMDVTVVNHKQTMDTYNDILDSYFSDMRGPEKDKEITLVCPVNLVEYVERSIKIIGMVERETTNWLRQTLPQYQIDAFRANFELLSNPELRKKATTFGGSNKNWQAHAAGLLQQADEVGILNANNALIALGAHWVNYICRTTQDFNLTVQDVYYIMCITSKREKESFKDDIIKIQKTFSLVTGPVDFKLFPAWSMSRKRLMQMCLYWMLFNKINVLAVNMPGLVFCSRGEKVIEITHDIISELYDIYSEGKKEFLSLLQNVAQFTYAFLRGKERYYNENRVAIDNYTIQSNPTLDQFNYHITKRIVLSELEKAGKSKPKETPTERYVRIQQKANAQNKQIRFDVNHDDRQFQLIMNPGGYLKTDKYWVLRKDIISQVDKGPVFDVLDFMDEAQLLKIGQVLMGRPNMPTK